MHIFKVLLFLNLGLIQSQTIDSLLYNQLVEKGEWNSIYKLNIYDEYKIVENLTILDSIYFIHQDVVKESFLKLLFRPILGLSNRNQALNELSTIKSAYPFIDDGSSMSFAKYDEKQVAAVINFNPQFKSQIGGILGASKRKNGHWVTTGQLDLHLENPRRKGLILDLNWQQVDAYSRKFHFSINNPFLFDLPFGTLVQFDQDFIEDSYILESTSGLLLGLSTLGRWKFGGKTEAGKDILLNTSFNSESIIIGFKADRRNNRWLPYKGLFWDVDFIFGRFQDDANKRIILETKFRIDQYRNIGKSVILFSSRSENIYLEGKELGVVKKVKFGGINSVRGYNENQFIGDWMFVQTIEWLFGDLSLSQAFLFTDIPITKNFIYPGYGLGFRQYKGGLSLDISIGFSKQSSGGKIHIKFSSDL